MHTQQFHSSMDGKLSFDFLNGNIYILITQLSSFLKGEKNCNAKLGKFDYRIVLKFPQGCVSMLN